MIRTLRIAFWVALLLLGLSPAMAQENSWPRTVPLDGGTVTIYEPQVDEMSEDFVQFRAALAYHEQAGDEPVFGAGWFESKIQVDQFSRTAHPVDIKVIQTRFPVEADVQTRLSDAMAQPSFAANFSFSLDELEESMKITQAEAQAAEKLNTAPPKIIYRDKPALLVNIDGEPLLREIENSSYEAVINTPYPLISDGKRFYLNAAQDVWYQADKAKGPYRFIDNPPSGIAALVKQDEPAGDDGSKDTLALTEKVTASNAPEIVVSTEPAELIVTEGPAAFVPLVDDLLVLNNSDDDVFMHLGEQEYYTVLAGRWYRSKSLDGPWTFQDSGDLPAAFANIPDDSDQADSRVYVAGTEEANEAVLDAQVPQTAAVERGTAEVEVQYDGAPEFEQVDGTDMLYVENTGSTVILSDGLYYLVEDGVWYVSTSHNGPWQVAVARPDQVRVILPTSPVYNVKYVYVYGYTPDVVYVGYTPGYMGSYVYHNTVFYGSGWYYRPWVSPRYYYPHHSTWGFHVNYDPWYGWNFGLSWAWGPFNFSFWPGGYWHHNHYWHHGHYSYWGPHGYRPRHHHHRPPGHRPPGHRPPGHRPPHGNRPHPYERHHNLYADGRQRARVTETFDKAPRSFDRSSADARFADKPHAKNTNLMDRKKTGYAATKPVSRGDLAGKAKAQNTGFRSAQKKVASSGGGKSYSKAYPGRAPASKTIRTTDDILKRSELANKAKSADQGFRAAQKKPLAANKSKSYGGAVKAPSGKTVVKRTATATKAPVQSKSRSYTKTVKSPDSGLKQKSTARVKTGEPVRTVRSSSQSKAKFASPPSKSVTRVPSRTKVVTSGNRSTARSPQKVTAPVSSSRAKSYTGQKTMPSVKLTRPATKSSYAYSKPKAPSASVNRAPKPQQRSSYTQVPKQARAPSSPKQARAPSSSKQKQSAPAQKAQKHHRVK